MLDDRLKNPASLNAKIRPALTTVVTSADVKLRNAGAHPKGHPGVFLIRNLVQEEINPTVLAKARCAVLFNLLGREGVRTSLREAAELIVASPAVPTERQMEEFSQYFE